MSVQTVTDMRSLERALKEPDAPAAHFWPGRAPYRKSDATWPQAGDLALCGEVKRGTAGKVAEGWAGVSCEQCVRLRGAGL